MAEINPQKGARVNALVEIHGHGRLLSLLFIGSCPGAKKLVLLPVFEISQLQKKPVNNFNIWVQCFSHYTAAMSKHYPECAAAFLRDFLIVFKTFNEVEHLAWREYGAYREIMASTSKKKLGLVWMWHCTKSCVGQDRNCTSLRRKERNLPRERG